MVNFNYSPREITLKVVYYGPALAGKTTNLEYIHKQVPPQARGKLLSMENDQDRTIFFDLLPVDVGTLGGFKVKAQLFSVPGKIKYDETRKLLLRAADGLVFVADSTASMMDFNLESFKSMQHNLKANNLNFETIPLVIQYNKQDCEKLSNSEEMDNRLNTRKVPTFRAVATTGEGVMETYNAVLERVLQSLQEKIGSGVQPLQTPRSRLVDATGPGHIRIVSMRRSPVELDDERSEIISADVAPTSPVDVPPAISPQSLDQQMKVIEDVRIRVDKLLADNHKIAAVLKKILIQMNEISQKMNGNR